MAITQAKNELVYPDYSVTYSLFYRITGVFSKSCNDKTNETTGGLEWKLRNIKSHPDTSGKGKSIIISTY